MDVNTGGPLRDEWRQEQVGKPARLCINHFMPINATISFQPSLLLRME